MKLDAAIALLRPVLPERSGIWVDLGAGEGLFTRALAAELPAGSRIIAVDRNAEALARLQQSFAGGGVRVETVTADLTELADALVGGALDGAVLANSLHFVSPQAQMLATLREKLRPGGSIIVVEYDNRPASPWVPYPVPAARLEVLAVQAGLAFGGVVADQASRYGGRIYSALLTRQDAPS